MNYTKILTKKHSLGILVFSFLLLSFSSCTSKKTPEIIPVRKVIKREYITAQENPIPGTEDRTWVEPMRDRVKVPGQLDPQGNYYRLPHSTYYEIRPGRYQEVPK